MCPALLPKAEPQATITQQPRRRAQIYLLCLLAGVFFLDRCAAAVLTVTNTADTGAGTLRATLANAANGDTISFALDLPATITLTSGELLITTDLTIVGPGPGSLAVDANHAGSVFHVDASSITVNISGLTVANGAAPFYGGGIHNGGATLAVSNCVLSGNVAGSGGGIYNDKGIVTVTACTLRGNSATNGNGGGIYNGAGNGGNATLTLRNSTLNGNAASIGPAGGGAGGAIYNNGFAGGNATNEISNCTLAGNTAPFVGGAIYNDGVGGTAVLKVVNSTLSGNSGDGIYNNGRSSGSAVLEIGNTLLSRGALGANITVDSATVISRGYNLSSDAAGGDSSTGPGGLLDAIGDQRNTDPLLDPAGLKDNGGLTPTIALRSSSPALDQGKRDTIPALVSNTDQRGEGRPFDDPNVINASGGDASDIGSYEASVRITAAEKIGADLALRFTSVLDKSYEVQSRDQAESGAWIALPGSVIGNGGVVQNIVPNIFTQATQFYRVHQSP